MSDEWWVMRMSDDDEWWWWVRMMSEDEWWWWVMMSDDIIMIMIGCSPGRRRGTRSAGRGGRRGLACPRSCGSPWSSCLNEEAAGIRPLEHIKEQTSNKTARSDRESHKCVLVNKLLSGWCHAMKTNRQKGRRRNGQIEQAGRQDNAS